MSDAETGSFLVKKFEIENLFGSHSLTLDVKTGLTAFIGKNGIGKTTALIALYGLLTNNFDILRGIPAKSLRLTLETESRPFVYPLITSEEWEAIQEIQGIFDCTFCEGRDLLSRFLNKEKNPIKITRDFIRHKRRDRTEVDRILQKIDNDFSEIFSRKEIDEEERKQLQVSKEIETNMDGWDILFFPTFRRIEVGEGQNTDIPMMRRVRGNPFGFNDDDDDDDKRSIEENYNYELRRLLHLSLKDIRSHLDNLKSETLELANSAYREATEGLIRYVLLDEENGTKNSNIDATEIQNSLSLLGMFEDKELESIMRKFSSSQSKQNDPRDNESEVKGVDHFISSLANGLGKKDQIQKCLTQFCETLNRYFEEKHLDLDQKTLEVSLKSENGQLLNWESLSSGEKQIVGILGEIFLKPVVPRASDRRRWSFVSLFKKSREKQKKQSERLMVLIDEPELSLGIEWQNDFLKDIMGAPNCGQLIAVTHSPSIITKLDYSEIKEIQVLRSENEKR